MTPTDYNLNAIEAFFKTFERNKDSGAKNSIGDLVDLDLLLTDSFFFLANHLGRGKVNPSELIEDWGIIPKPRKAEFAFLLSKSESTGSVRPQLESLYPDFMIYRSGKEVIRSLDNKLKVDSIDWDPIKVKKAIRVGESDKSIPIIRERLFFWDYLKSYTFEDERFFDSNLFKGLQLFQKKNGMEPDGIIGKMTASAINYSPQDLIDKASVNLERLRWLPDSVKNEEFILVNIANFQLDYLSNMDTLLTAELLWVKNTMSLRFSAQK